MKLSIYVFLLITILVHGSFNSSQIKFDYITQQDGLSSSSVYSLFQDSYGFLWIGTGEGLNRYDGKNIKVYKHLPFDTLSLSDNWVISITEDSRRRVWVGTHNGGLNLLNRVDGTFKVFEYNNNSENSIASNRVWKIFEYNDSTLFLGTSGGLTVLNTNTFNTINYVNDKSDTNSISSNAVNDIFRDSKGNIWIGTFSGGLNKLTEKDGKLQFLGFADNKNDLKLLSEVDIKRIHEDKFGNLWLGTYRDGLIKYNNESKRIIQFLPDAKNPNSIGQNSVFSIVDDDHENLWVGTHYEGVYVIEHDNLNDWDKNLEFTSVKFDPYFPGALNNNSAISMFRNKNNLIWIGTDNGVNKYNPAHSSFKTVYLGEKGDRSYGGNTPKSIFADDDGKLWIGTYGDGLKLYDKTSLKLLKEIKSDGSSSISSNTIWQIKELDKNRLLLGTSYGLNIYDKNTGMAEVLYKNSQQHSLSHNNISAIQKVNNNLIAVGTWGGGLNIYEISSGKFFTYTYDFEKPNSVSSNVIKKLYYDNKGFLWICTFGGGLNRVNLQNYKPGDKLNFEKFIHDPRDNKTISSNNPTDIIQFNDNTYFVATNGGGLNRLEFITGKSKPEIKVYTEDEGLVNNAIAALLIDDNRDIWFSSSNGLTRFNVETETFFSFDKEDGLQDNEYDQSAFKDSDGNLYFGGMRGFDVFHPNKIMKNRNIPNIVITSVVAFDNSTGKSISLPLKDEIDLSYNNNSLNFTFSALDFTRPERNQYAYKLDGFDNDWVYCGTQNSVRYTNLPGGKYVFMVKGSNNEGLWNEEGTYLPLVVATPPWLSWWAAIIYIILLAVIIKVVSGIYGDKQKQELKLREKELEIEKRANKKLKFEEKQKNTLYKISLAAHNATDLVDLYKKVHEIVSEIMVAKNFYIALYNKENNTIEYPYIIDECENIFNNRIPPEPKDKGLTAYIIDNKIPQLITAEEFVYLSEKGIVTQIGALSLEWIGAPLIDSNEEVIGVIAVQTYDPDIHYTQSDKDLLAFISTQIAMAINRKRTEQVSNKFEFIVNAAKSSITLINKEYEYEAVNDHFCISHNCNAKDIVGTKVSEIWGFSDFQNVIKKYLDRAFKGEDLAYQAWFETRSGGLACYDVHCFPYRESGLDVTHVVVISRDITMLVTAEENVKKLLRAVEQTEEVIFMTELDGKINYINPAFEEVYGYTRDEVVGNYPNILKSDKMDAAFYKNLWQTILDGNKYRSEIVNRKKDGTFVEMEAIISPVLDNSGILKGYIAVQIDITERKKAEKELLRAKELAEKTAKLKSEFLSQISHEIRTPLNAILNTVDILHDEVGQSIPDDLNELICNMKYEGKRIIRTVHLLVDMSELQTGMFDYNPTKLNIIEVLTEVCDKLSPEAEEKQIIFNTDIASEEINVIGDVYSLEQIFLNLIDNAIKFTFEGSVSVKTEVTEQKRLKVKIEDTGIGISESYLPELFNPFTQEEMGYTKQYQGNGLGLALVKRYCELNLAQIEVNSEKGKGSVFTLTFAIT